MTPHLRPFFVAGAALALVSCSPTKSPAPAKSADDGKSSLHYMQERVTVGGADVMIDKIAEAKNYPGQLPGAVAIAVDYVISNNGDHPLPVDRVPAMHIMDQKGVVYNQDPALTMAYYQQHAVTRKASDLNPGLTETDSAVFEVAASRFDETKWFITMGGGEKIVMCHRTEAVDGVCAPFPLLE